MIKRFLKLLVAKKDVVDVIGTIVEIVVAILLGAMAVIVSIKANEIAFYANKLTKASNQPTFGIDSYQTNYDSLNQRFQDNCIDVIHLNGNFYNLDTDTKVVLEINYEKGNQLKKAILPLYGYFHSTYRVSPGSGIVRKIRGPNNLINMNLFKQKVDSILNKQGIKSTINEKHYLLVKYKDFQNEPHSLYFDVWVDGKLEDEEDGKEIFKLIENEENKGPIIDIAYYKEEHLLKYLASLP